MLLITKEAGTISRLWKALAASILKLILVYTQE